MDAPNEGQHSTNRQSSPDFRRPDGVIELRVARLPGDRLLRYVLLLLPLYAVWIAFFGDRPRNRVVIILCVFAFSAGSLLLIRSANHRAVLIDGTRVGWVHGLTSRAKHWADLDDLVSVSTIVGKRDVQWRLGNLAAPKKTVILWTNAGGMPARRVANLYRHNNRDLHNEMRAKLAEGLHPFYVDMFDLGSDRAAVFETILDRYRPN
jgi:hypothetical protein